MGANGGSFSGRVDITVGYEDGVAIGGLAYDINTGGVARFDDVDFNRYCRQILEEEYWVDRQTLSYVRFDVLPDSTEGVLYYDYRSASNPGSRASAGTSYYYGSRTPRIDLLTLPRPRAMWGPSSSPLPAGPLMAPGLTAMWRSTCAEAPARGILSISARLESR